MNAESLLTRGDTLTVTVGNADGKRWVMPVGNLRTALCLYQPGAMKGKLLKALLPVISGVAPLRAALLRRIGGELRPLALIDRAREAIAAAFGVCRFSWALFSGTPSPHSKPTLQIWDAAGSLLGYCKFTDSPALYQQLFLHEASVLSRLADAGMRHVPRVLACRQLADNLFFFAQSTEKTPHSLTPHKWGIPHDRFIADLEAASIRRMAWEQTDTYRSLDNLASGIGRLDRRHIPAVSRHLDDIMAHMASREVEAVTVHSDFTPWNSALTPGGDLFVFDWEYAAPAGLRGLDLCHFLVQSAIFEQHLELDAIVERLSMANVDVTTLRIYLLDILSRFSARDPAGWTAAPNHLADTWVSLLDRHI